MNTALEARIRAAGAEMSKPGRWRLAQEQLHQAASQIVSSAEIDLDCAQLALENLQLLYQWASVMPSHEYHLLNQDVMHLSDYLAQHAAD